MIRINVSHVQRHMTFERVKKCTYGHLSADNIGHFSAGIFTQLKFFNRMCEPIFLLCFYMKLKKNKVRKECHFIIDIFFFDFTINSDGSG